MTVSWDDLAGSLPVHEAEVMSAHQGTPSVAVQGATHGAPSPAEDNGMTEQEKYGGQC